MKQRAQRLTRRTTILLTVLLLLGPVVTSKITPGSCTPRMFCALAQSSSRDPHRATLSPTPADTDLPTSVPALDSPLLRLHPFPFTAHGLGQGEVMINTRGRLYDSSSSVERSGITFFYDVGFSWGITKDLEMALQFQHMDSNFPERQGRFQAVLTSDNEGTLALKYQLWQDASRTFTLSGVSTLSMGDRGARFIAQRQVVEQENQTPVPSLQLPFTITLQDRWNLTIAPTVAFFPDSHALFLFRSPGTQAEFGTLFGLAGAVAYRLSQRLSLWGDAFVPAIGHNTVNRDSGRPDTTVAFNAGMRYLLHPRLALDVFASNTLGSVGSLALLADQDNIGLGTAVAFLPDFVAANRRYPDRFATTEVSDTVLSSAAGIAFFDGGTLPGRSFLLNLQGGQQGVLSSLHYSPVKDLELALYLDYILSDIDESEQGVGLKLRVLNQGEGHPLTASIAVTIGLTNRVFRNFFTNDRDAFNESGLTRNVPFLLRGDDGPQSELFLATISLPLQYQFANDAAVWLTPIVGIVQRQGIELAGVNIGGSVPLMRKAVSVLAEVGANFAGQGNAFLDDDLDDMVPWAAAARLHLGRLSSRARRSSPGSSYLELYVTNRVGSSPFHSLRVRADNNIAVGGSLAIPFTLF